MVYSGKFKRTDVGTHACGSRSQCIASLKRKYAALTFMGSKPSKARLSNDVVPIDDNVNSNYKQVTFDEKVEITFGPPFTSGGKFGLLKAPRS